MVNENDILAMQALIKGKNLRLQIKLMPFVWNFALMAFITGVMGSITTFLIWYNIKGTKPIIRFEYST